MSEENKDFVVKDHRIFSGEEDNKGPATEEKKEQPSEKGQEDRDRTEESTEGVSEDSASETSQEAESQMPEINFSTFVFSLNASALVNLGGMENPATGIKEKNLPLAKQTIDILGMLEEKTRGNLDSDEENLLKNILYDLRLNYVKEKK